MGIINNYHTHTKRCGHAVDEDEDYVLGAIEAGIKILGFSDHISFTDYDFPLMRQSRKELDDYINSINYLKEKYKDRIEIHIGFEAEYLEEYLDDYKELLDSKKIEYLICGQHCYIKDGKQISYNSLAHSEENVVKYVDAVINAIKSGLFTYIAHPDYFMNGYRDWDEVTIRESKRIIEAAKEYNVPLELNVGGLRYAYKKHKKNPKGHLIEHWYPYEKFWELVSKYNVQTIIGVDAHSKSDFLDKTDEETLEFAKRLNLKIIDRIDLD